MHYNVYAQLAQNVTGDLPIPPSFLDGRGVNVKRNKIENVSM